MKFEPYGGAKIDPDSVKMTYLRTPNVDLTSRVRSFVLPSGIDMPEVELPVGEHMVRRRHQGHRWPRRDNEFCPEGRPLSAACPYCARENLPEALVCGSCSREIAVPKSLVSERDELARKRDALRLELDQARAELEALRRRKKRSV